MSFADLLNTPVDTIEAPRPMPIGTWRFDINVVKVFEPKDEDSAGAILFGLKPQEPSDDVDTADLEDYDLESAQAWKRFRLRDKKDAFYITKFIETVGVETSGRSLEDAAKACEGYAVMAYAEQEPNYRDPEITDTVLRDFAPVA